MNLKLAIVAPGEFFGGAERQILSLLDHLQNQSITCKLILLHDRELATQARALGADPYITGNGRRFDFQALFDLRSVLQTYNVVHTHGYKATILAALARPRKGFTLVKTEHGRVEVGRGSVLQRLTSNVYRKLENSLSRRVEATVVYVTEELRLSCLTEHEGMASRIIHNGIDSSRISNLIRPEEFSKEYFNLVVLGRLENVKGVQYAIDAMQDLDVPDKIKLHIVGDGPLYYTLTTLAKRGPREASIVFHGFRSDGARFAAHADLLLIPSQHEGLPYTLLEAVCAGTPVCASNVGGLAEVLQHERTALLIPPANPLSIRSAILRLYNDDKFRLSLAATAKAELSERFSSKSMGDAYINLYRDLYLSN
ncbi:hypothetical protein ACG33_10146 [Steroidobacter denitrificans]|uniref:Glycosyltransferase subfamily 4-like N-terminal domain-containing protein n=1 Tax=Steroidobacter denitrificans TaxID=465721 RepID=A0A127FAK3_STEDE|nr:glycosyltransferase family 4 protein [Steroidobacter denitrificans]AMN47453.1 hypothetical protein ACG33_10146 [Steroidobacter denitrificans]